MNQSIINLESPCIQSYSNESLFIDNKKFCFPLILTPKELILNSIPTKFDEFYPEKISDIVALNPELILIGTGPEHRVLENRFSELAIGIDIMTTGAACRIFNVMIEENRNVAAALY